ncbi:hypothetical protein RJ640_007990 [Escallonia rubra]|uniref:F-box domain-containing protein n=1 Tax=Escallonia rubra TaxID=112253 RepID=A0AA88TZP8_9ASTE|nr:hypothetical protein RJ640_007990 [Escallonia rubra]
MDRVSELPDFVLQHIQSFLSTKQAAQTSVLSKAWQRAWSTRPTLDFDQSYFCRALQPLESRDNFLGFAGRTLQRYLVENLRIERFRLSVIMVDGSMLSFVEECIGTSVKSGVEELDLSFMALGLFYTVPQRIFTAKSLKVLKVRGDMSQPVEVRSDHVINLCYLKVLSLDYVYVDDRTIQNFISGCPLVENLILRNCEGLKEIKVDDKVNCLKEFRIESMYELEQVDIEAPRLELLRKTEHTAEEDGGVEEGLIIKQSDRKDQESESEAVKTSNEEDIHESGASIFGRVAEEGDKKNGSSIIKALVTYVKQGIALSRRSKELKRYTLHFTSYDLHSEIIRSVVDLKNIKVDEQLHYLKESRIAIGRTLEPERVDIEAPNKDSSSIIESSY